MKTEIKILSSLVVGLFLVAIEACSTASIRVLPSENGEHKVVARDIERENAEEEALEAAKDFCKETQQRVVVIKSATSYHGSMDEGTRRLVRSGSKAAMILGSMDPNASAEKDVVGSAGTVGYQMTSDRDYLNELTFKCK